MAVAVGCAPGGPGGGAPAAVAAECMLRDRLPQLWRSIESAHYSYLETDDSPEKLQQRKKLEGYIMEYLSLVPHECKFGLSETGRVFARTVADLPEFSAYRAGMGWAALARYAANLLAQPWRKEYKTIRLYCGYYKHEVEANLVSAELLLGVMGYRPDGVGRVSLDGPVCPDLVAAVSRDALIAYVECQMMCEVWERAWRGRGGASWAQVARERARRAGDVPTTVARLTRNDCAPGLEIYSNVKLNSNEVYRSIDTEPRRPAAGVRLPPLDRRLPPEQPAFPLVQPYVTLPAGHLPHNLLYSVGPQEVGRYPNDISSQCMNGPLMNPYGVMPGFYYSPMQGPYMVPPAPMYAPIKQAATIPVNGYPQIHRYPAVPTAQLIELDPPSDYLSSDVPDGRHRHTREETKSYRDESNSYRDERKLYREDSKSCREDSKSYREESKSHRDDSQSYWEDYKSYKEDRDRHNKPHDCSQHQEHRKPNMNKSTYSDVSLSRSDTQPALGAARDDGTGTYESWDYVFRNLSSHDYDNGRHRRVSPPPERDSRTLERLERDERRRFQPTTMDLEDGLNALNLDRSYDDEIYRTAKVNENLMRMKQESEMKKAKALAKKQLAEEREKRSKKPIEQPIVEIDTVNPKIAADKVRLISKKDAKDRKEIQKQYSNGSTNGIRPEIKMVKKVVKSLSSEAERPVKLKPTVENGMQSMVYGAKASSGTSSGQHKEHNGLRDLGSQLVVSLDEAATAREPPRWECAACTFANKHARAVCEMCGKSRRAGPEAAPLTSGGRECPACTLVNRRDALACEACDTNLDHSPTYI